MECNANPIKMLMPSIAKKCELLCPLFRHKRVLSPGNYKRGDTEVTSNLGKRGIISEGREMSNERIFAVSLDSGLYNGR